LNCGVVRGIELYANVRVMRRDSGAKVAPRRSRYVAGRVAERRVAEEWPLWINAHRISAI